MSKVDTKPFMLQVIQHKIFLYMSPVTEILTVVVNTTVPEDLDVLSNLLYCSPPSAEVMTVMDQLLFSFSSEISIGALLQQFPLSLIDTRNPNIGVHPCG